MIRSPVGPDPRVEIVVVRREGAGAFGPGDSAASVVCRVPRLPCVDRAPGHRTYRYAATARDAWGSSRSVLSEAVSVPNSKPLLTLSGPRVVRVGARAVYRARVADLDGDRLRLAWRVDGRALRGSARAVTVRFRTRGLHRVSVTVRDGHGGTTSATLRLRARG
jgi:PKD domain